MSNGVGTGFLKFNSHPPRLYVTGDDDEPDEKLLQYWEEEGFDVTYLPRGDGGKPYRDQLKLLNQGLVLGENYGIVAFGDAAAECLDAHIKPHPHLAALIAYYPTEIPSPKAKYPSQLHLLVHLAGTQGLSTAFPSYTYPGAQPGFAEHDLPEYNKVASSLSWTRTLTVLRRAFNITADLERVRENHIQLQYSIKAPAKTLANMVADKPVINNVPTMIGGVGQRDIFLFYRDYFRNPPSLRLKLVSRTIGQDRIVDEMVTSFKHTEEVHWILPGVPPTDKVVHIPMVSVLCVRGGRVCSENMYWDQASVLVQVGLLDPRLVPEGMKRKGLRAMPVCGSEAAAKVLDEESHASNEMIPKWKDRPRGDPGAALPNRQKQNGAQSNGARNGAK